MEPVPNRASGKSNKPERYVVQADGPLGHPLTGYTVVDTKTGKTVDHNKLTKSTLPFLGLGEALDLKNSLNAKKGK